MQQALSPHTSWNGVRDVSEGYVATETWTYQEGATEMCR